MYTDLTDEFLKHGHEVYVAAPGKDKTRITNEGNIRVLRIKTLPLFNKSMILKGLANLLLPFQYKIGITRKFRETGFDLVIEPTPPITFTQLARHLKKKHSAKIYLILRDIFPQNAKDIGLIKNSILYNYFRRKERKLYELADAIGCMSPKNIDYIHTHNPEVDVTKLHLLPNWTRVHESSGKILNGRPGKKLINKFIAVFGGNFGLPQKIEFLIQVAERLREKKDILFYLIGGGTELGKIKKMVVDKKLENVIIKEQMPRDNYLELLQECDVGLVNLSDRFTIPNIPSRTLSYWSLKLPVLAAVDKSTDFGTILEKCNGGLWSVTGNTDAYIENLLFLYNNPDKKRQMGENGYNYLVEELNSEKAYNTILSRFKF
jgi:glycosyltransferase involved in cell wall biosynthesis